MRPRTELDPVAHVSPEGYNDAPFFESSTALDNPDSVRVRVVRDNDVIQTENMLAYMEARYPGSRLAEEHRKLGIETSICIPVADGDKALGLFLLNRNDVRAFTEDDITLITLVQTFGAQADLPPQDCAIFDTKGSIRPSFSPSSAVKTVSVA